MTFIPFDNLDDAFAKMREAEERANANVLPAQIHGCKYGSYFMRPFPEMRLLVFGHILLREELEQGEEPETMEVLDASYARGYRFSKCFSKIEPRGELGDVHISTMCPISHELFMEAEQQGWTLTMEQYRGALFDAGMLEP